MRYWKNKLGGDNIYSYHDPGSGDYCEQNPQSWTEVDAQGNPLNAGSGTAPTSNWPVTGGGGALTFALTKSCSQVTHDAQIAENERIYAERLSRGQDTSPCFGAYCNACKWVLPSPVQNKKPEQESWVEKVVPKFAGEARCDFSTENEVLRGAPKEPWFGDHERSRQSMRVIKRWTATNLRTWPVGRFDRQPAQLMFYPRSHDGGDGQYIRAVFECGCCR